MTIGLIINPKARAYYRSSQVPESLDKILGHTEVEVLEEFSTLPQIISRLAKKKCRYQHTHGFIHRVSDVGRL